jgi:hypothetical protein
LIGGSTGLDLDHDWVVLKIILKVGNTNHVDCSRTITRIDKKFVRVVPSNLPVLGGVEAHLSNFV